MRIFMGENISATITAVTNREYEISITGYGDMYQNVNNFKRDEDTPASWSNYWRGCVTQNMIIPNGITSIAESCFELTRDNNGSYNRTTRFFIPSSVTKIGDMAFRGYKCTESFPSYGNTV